MNLSSPLSGIVPPLVTPLRDRDTLDGEGLERLIEHVIAGGVSALFLLGTTGEGPSLSYRLRGEAIRTACRAARGRVPVLVGITDTAFVESVQLARCAADAGAAAVVAAPPYYLPEGQPELIEYTGHLLDELPLPLFLYNMPALTKVSFELDTVRRLLDDPRIPGIKDSSGNMVHFHRLCRHLKDRPDWTILMGPEELLLDAVMAGGHGGVNGGANVFPSLYVALHQAAVAGDLARARELHGLVLEVSERLYQVGRHPSAIIKGLKCALSLLGICDDFMAEPFHRFRDEERRQIEASLGILGPKITALSPLLS
ncbi:MAG: dihydrodipicolinate synthase family protein [Verrucomicrobiales bacterium]|nr:dihydrodipicolinate synthase family protein [Verrucomicrobiales bacterium]